MTKKIALILFLIIFLINFVQAEDVVDLGGIGYTAKINKIEILKDHNKTLRAHNTTIEANFAQQPDFKYKSGLSRYSGMSETKNFKLDKEARLPKKVIYVFSALDSYCEEKAKEVSVDYGLCIDFNSLSDIAEFRRKTGIKWPIAIANDNIIQFLKLEHYPALVKIEGGEVEITTGF